ncbi:formate dehydrogenase subunit delta [Salibaculum griseiflavum]|jgi:formate dehydrogenase subunit delta|uniref:Formate dehydrogenase n=1 Tax=Salibaculum griseiflavum TaxID=1914409 RepID=A0A2V1P7L9_9RHOB|nr:formate dehydrogenase subunit delta [Salibaculum griseiflavum]PWG17367.1 formate dehydrogenase [Salibaculum griseiflavum]
MSPEKMVRMANQIATFFESQPDEDKAGRVAAHLGDFWEPRMLEQLRAHLEAGGEGLSPLARQGAERVLAEKEQA